MAHNKKIKKSPEQEVLEELKELEALAAQIPPHQGELHYELMMAEIIDQIQNACPQVRQASDLRKLIARFGDAYFFFNQTGDFCLLTDFLHEAKIVEQEFPN